jgi:hypothetical protein
MYAMVMETAIWQQPARIGTPLMANNVIRAFRIITKKAGLGDE